MVVGWVGLGARGWGGLTREAESIAALTGQTRVSQTPSASFKREFLLHAPND